MCIRDRCTLHNSIVLIVLTIFLPEINQIIKDSKKLTKLCQKQFWLFFIERQCTYVQKSARRRVTGSAVLAVDHYQVCSKPLITSCSSPPFYSAACSSDPGISLQDHEITFQQLPSAEASKNTLLQFCRHFVVSRRTILTRRITDGRWTTRRDI